MCALSLGIDTSNYTTSIALVNEKMKVIYNKGILLDVKPGMRGLRQSDALFQHIDKLPKMLKEIPIDQAIKVICCSNRPRPLKDSYMPVFKVGSSLGDSLAALMKLDCIKVSHQENHIRSAIYGSGQDVLEERFCAIHFSGGTSELLGVEKKPLGYDCQIIAKSLDLNAGQLIDRVGLMLGLDFPAGRELEELAQKADLTCDKEGPFISARLAGVNFHFSGQENQATKALENNIPKELIAWQLLYAISQTLIQSIKALQADYDFQSLLFSGGVMSNNLIKGWIDEGLKNSGLTCHFSPGAYARDNAVGNALMGMEYYQENK